MLYEVITRLSIAFAGGLHDQDTNLVRFGWRVDVVVLGAGPAGLTAAADAAEGGASVLVPDEEPQPGGHQRW